MKLAVMVTLAATLTASALAQRNPPTAPVNQRTHSGSAAVDIAHTTITGPNTTVEACSATKHDASGFTECESLKLLYLTSLETPYQLKLQQMDKDVSSFIESLSPNYPGKTYEPPSRDYPIGRLVEPVKAPVAPKNIATPTPQR